ncbi:hypothetical protein OVA03_05005 [Asticcacaulis sp. SL142]|uniref:hypothetical protein n=1 Tax=Asticcacaulis sp. SL142 TaxID=2995155 RepID=UPI00226D03A3|nr:hypothetical protein [Asticcacaulis sp. SL142]WAC49270.1 hypothetical protein OVA03_05005 [Asticcacaulis sp. SL142]
MANILIALVVAILTFFSIRVAMRLIVKRTEKLATASQYIEEAYEAAQQLIKDHSTPDSILKFVSVFYANINKPSLARTFTLHCLNGKSARNSVPRTQRSAKFSDDLQSLSPQQVELFGEMLTKGMMASAYCDPIFYSVHINLWSSTASETTQNAQSNQPSPEKARTVALDLNEKYSKDNRDLDFACAA